jgi:UDP-N-acetylglucosamine 2-epimerase (non-hydrolysing)
MHQGTLDFAGLPFLLTPDSEMHFASRSHREVRAQLDSFLGRDHGVAAVIGAVGTGKTTLIRTLMSQWPEGAGPIAHIVSSRFNAEELLQAVLVAFGIVPRCDPATLRSAPEEALHRFLEESSRAGRKPLLIADEAQGLAPAALARLIGWADRAAQQQWKFQAILAGQPELGTSLSQALGASPEAATDGALQRFGLKPLSRAEVRSYIEHRMRRAGCFDDPHIEDSAFEAVFAHTEGNPRLINRLCNRVLVDCRVTGRHCIDEAMVEHTAHGLRLEIDGVSDTPLSALVEASVPQNGKEAPRRAPRTRAPLVFVMASGHGDHVRAAPLLRAFAQQREIEARLVTLAGPAPHDINAALFHGLQPPIAACREACLSASQADIRAVLEVHRPDAVVSFGASAGRTAVVTAARSLGLVSCVADAGAQVHESAGPAADASFIAELRDVGTLLRAGASRRSIHFAGNLLVDAMALAMALIDRAPGAARAPQCLNGIQRYGVVTLGLQAHLAETKTLERLVAMLGDVSRDLFLVWPLHARMRQRLQREWLDRYLDERFIACIDLGSYLEFIALLRNAACALTDSRNVQDETTALGVPCLTLGLARGRPVVCAQGSNVDVGFDHARAHRVIWDCLFTGGREGDLPLRWDGWTASRIVQRVAALVATRREQAA